MNTKTRKTPKSVDPDTVNSLIDAASRVDNVCHVLECVSEHMPGNINSDLNSGTLYCAICTLEGVTRDLYAVTDGMEV